MRQSAAAALQLKSDPLCRTSPPGGLLIADTKELRLEAVRVLQQAAGIGAYAFAALTGAQYPKLLGLRAASERALHRGDLAEAEQRAQELLDLAERFKSDWNYGNAVHHGYLLRGQVALARGDVATAVAHLEEAGRTPGSPQLNSFGPNMHLAQALLSRGQADSVTAYLELCRKFWPTGPIDRWIGDIRDGREPDFGANVVY
jgi:tetratricopeptide (TPR) repeat protein